MEDIYGKLVLVSVENTTILSGVPWHPTRIDELDLPSKLSGFKITDEVQCQGHVTGRIIRTPRWLAGCSTAICLFNWNRSVYGPEHESSIYRLIQGFNIGPRFLAHITENNTRIIGYMVERIQGRLPTAADLHACRSVLGRLHSLGISLGKFTKKSFIVDDETGCAYISSFITADTQGTSQDVYDAEQRRLEHVLGVAATRERLDDTWWANNVRHGPLGTDGRHRTGAEELQAQFAAHNLDHTPKFGNQNNIRHVPVQRPANCHIRRTPSQRGCSDVRRAPSKRHGDNKLGRTRSRR